MTRAFFAAALIAVLSACSGGGQSGPAPMALLAVAPAESAAVAPVVATGAAHFTITVPAATTSTSSRHADFVSASTQSIVITLSAVNGTPYTGALATIASNLT